MENSSFFAENMFSLFFPQKYVGTQSFGSRSIFCPLTSKTSFFAKNFENLIIFSFFVEPESRNQSGNVLIIVDGIEMKKKSSKY